MANRQQDTEQALKLQAAQLATEITKSVFAETGQLKSTGKQNVKIARTWETLFKTIYQTLINEVVIEEAEASEE